MGILYGVQTLVCSRRASTIAHIYPSVLQAIVGGAMRNVWRGDFMGYWGVVMQDLGYELPRIPILGTSVYRATQAQWRCPDSRMTALCFLSFRAGSGCNHSETWAGCIVSLTTPTRSSLRASRSVSSLSAAEKASRVLAASYFLL